MKKVFTSLIKQSDILLLDATKLITPETVELCSKIYSSPKFESPDSNIPTLIKQIDLYNKSRSYEHTLSKTLRLIRKQLDEEINVIESRILSVTDSFNKYKESSIEQSAKYINDINSCNYVPELVKQVLLAEHTDQLKLLDAIFMSRGDYKHEQSAIDKFKSQFPKLYETVISHIQNKYAQVIDTRNKLTKLSFELDKIEKQDELSKDIYFDLTQKKQIGYHILEDRLIEMERSRKDILRKLKFASSRHFRTFQKYTDLLVQFNVSDISMYLYNKCNLDTIMSLFIQDGKVLFKEQPNLSFNLDMLSNNKMQLFHVERVKKNEIQNLKELSFNYAIQSSIIGNLQTTINEGNSIDVSHTDRLLKYYNNEILKLIVDKMCSEQVMCKGFNLNDRLKHTIKFIKGKEANEILQNLKADTPMPEIISLVKNIRYSKKKIKVKTMNPNNIGFDYDLVLHLGNRTLPNTPLLNIMSAYIKEGKNVFVVTHNRIAAKNNTIAEFLQNNIGELSEEVTILSTSSGKSEHILEQGISEFYDDKDSVLDEIYTNVVIHPSYSNIVLYKVIENEIFKYQSVKDIDPSPEVEYSVDRMNFQKLHSLPAPWVNYNFCEGCLNNSEDASKHSFESPCKITCPVCKSKKSGRRIHKPHEFQCLPHYKIRLNSTCSNIISRKIQGSGLSISQKDDLIYIDIPDDSKRENAIEIARIILVSCDINTVILRQLNQNIEVKRTIWTKAMQKTIKNEATLSTLLSLVKVPVKLSQM